MHVFLDSLHLFPSIMLHRQKVSYLTILLSTSRFAVKSMLFCIGLYCDWQKKKMGLLSPMITSEILWMNEQIGNDWFTAGTSLHVYEPRCEKTGLRGFRPGPTQTGLYSHRRWLEA